MHAGIRGTSSVMLGVMLALGSSALAQQELRSNFPIAPAVLDEPGFVVDELAYPLMNLRAVRDEDSRSLALGDVPRFAIGNDVNITPMNAGSIQDLGNGTWAWRVRLTCENAQNMNIGTLWHVPASVKMYLLDASGFTPYGAYTAADNKDHGELWTPIVAGSVMEVYVEFAERDWDAFAAGFTIIRVSTGYRHFGEALMDGLRAREQGADGHVDDDRSAACNVDVACEEAYPWCLQVKGAACYTLNGNITCSGGMLNNVRENQDPIFMSANHCGVQNSPASIVVYWNFQNATCRIPGSGDSAGGGTCSPINSGSHGAPCNTTTTSGSTLIVTYQPADWTITRLSSTPPDSYHVVYLGWDNRAPEVVTPTSGFGISHPGVQEKRISIENNPFETAVISIGGPAIQEWWIQYDEGGIEQGSSGSPLFNQDGRVVGTATAVDTLTACFPQSTFYGRLDYAWANEPLISGALDPDATGATTLNMHQFFPAGPPDTFGFAPNSPSNGLTNVPKNASLDWGGSCGSQTFHVVLSQNSDLSSPIIDQVVGSTQTAIGTSNLLQYGQTYYWGVTATNGLGTVSSVPASAQFIVQPFPIGAFSLVAPANGVLGTTTSPQLQWTSASGALSYRVEIDDDSLFGSPITKIVNAPTTQVQLAVDELASGTKYWWRVTAVNPPDELPSAQTWTLTTQSAPRACAGDVDRDGFTNVSDFNILAGHFGQSVQIGINGDLNDDTIVNVGDFNVLAGNYGCHP